MAVEKETHKRKTKSPAEKSKPKVDASSQRQLKIQLVRSVIGRPKIQREVVKGLGLRKLHSAVIRKDCPEVRGMIRKIPHLVTVEVLEKK